jgi:hypothetical protein
VSASRSSPAVRLASLFVLLALSLPVCAGAWGAAGAQSGRTQTSPAGKARTTSERPRAVGVTPASPTSQPTPAFTPAGAEPAAAPAATPTPTPQGKTGAINNTPPEEVDDDEVVSISSNLVPIPARVLDAQGRAVVNLELKDFELNVDGRVQPIGDLSRSETPVTIAFLFDNSSSLRASRQFEVKAAVEFFRRVMRPIDRAAIFSISSEPELSLPLTDDVRALVRVIENFGRPKGATALFDTMAEAARYLKPHRGRKVIVIISDGTDTLSRLTFDETFERVLAADCQSTPSRRDTATTPTCATSPASAASKS